MRYLLLVSFLLLGGCALERELPAAPASPLDSTLRAAGLTTGKIKFNGPVTLQIGGSGNVATTTALAKAKVPVATAPHATASAPAAPAGPPWYVYAGLVLLGATLYAGLCRLFPILSFFK